MNKLGSLFKAMAAFLFLILFLAITVGIFSVPSLYFSLKEELLLETAYERHIVPINIAPEAEEIYMVRAIRDIYWLNIKTYHSAEKLVEDPEYGKLRKDVEQFYPLPYENQADVLSWLDTDVLFNDGMSLFLHIMLWEYNDSKTTISFHQESKTGKVIFIASDDNDVVYDILSKYSYYNHTHNENDLAEKFCEYLGLDILDDWTFTSEGLISNKASLKIVCHLSETKFILYAAPLELQWEQTEEELTEMEFQEASFYLTAE